MAYEKITFSRAKLADLANAPDGKRSYFSDTREPGLVFMVTDKGAKSFQLYVKHGGRPVRVTLGRFSESLPESVELPRDCTHSQFLANNPDLNVKMARALAAALKIDIKSGISPSEVKKARRGEMTVGDLFEAYVDRHLRPHKRDENSARAYYELYVGLIPPPLPGKKKRVKLPGCVSWHNRLITSISTDDVQRLITGLAAKGGSIHNANRVLTILKSMYARAKDWGIFKGDNPTDGVQKFETKSRERFLQSDEAPRFFDSLSLEPNEDIRDYVMLSILTGARKRNIHGMQWANLNLNREIWVIPGEASKNGDQLSLPLVPAAVDILERRKPKKAAVYVFPGKGKSGHLENSRSGWDRVLDRDEVIQLAKRIEEAGGDFQYSFNDPKHPGYGHLKVILRRARAMAGKMEIDVNGTRLKDLRPHDLRRTLGSWQASTGASMLVIGKTLGHKSQAATSIYARLNLDPIRQSMTTATSALLAAGNAKQSGDVVNMGKKKA